MTPENILKLLKSGIWEDALIAFHMMKDWTMRDINAYFSLDAEHRLSLEDSSHIREYIKINNNLYMTPGGSWSIRFHDHPSHSNKEYIPL